MKIKKSHHKSLLLTLASCLLIISCKEQKNTANSSEPPAAIEGTDISLEGMVETTAEETPNDEVTEETLESDATEQIPVASLETIPNPQYTSWVGFPVGTKITLENVTESAGMTQKSIIIQTLKEVTPQSVTYDVQIKTSIGGVDTEIPSQTQTISAVIPAGTPIRPADMPGVNIIEETQEEITIGDTLITAKKTKFETSGGEDSTSFKSVSIIWESDQVPGGIVKMQNTVTMGENTTESIMTLISIERGSSTE